MLKLNGNEKGIFIDCLKQAYSHVSKESDLNGKGSFYGKIDIIVINDDNKKALGTTHPSLSGFSISINKAAFKKYYDMQYNKTAIMNEIIRVLRHEFRHVAQFIALKKIFGDKNKVFSFVSKLQKQFDYQSNPLEMDARAHETWKFTSTSCLTVMQGYVKLYA